jgi:alpha-ribazole phosphatase
MDIYLIRHTRVQGIEGICYGRSDVGLGPDFPAEAQEVKRRLSSLEKPVVFSSPSSRCLALAKILGADTLRISPELQEMNFGSWEMKPWASIPREDMDLWANDYMNAGCPEGESLRDMTHRVLAFWKNLVAQGISQSVLVSHAGPIRIILSSLMNIPPKDMFSLAVDFGSVWKIKLREGDFPALSTLE